MEAFLQFIQTIFPVIVTHKQLFLFIGAMLEGMNTMILGGFLVSINSIPFLSTFVLFLFAYIVNGYMWYAIGFFAGAKPLDRWSIKNEKRKETVEKVKSYVSKHSGWAIIITKFTFSLTIATLIIVGSVRYSLRRFTVYNFVGSVGWVALTMFIGFFFGESYKLFSEYLRNFTIGVVFLVAAIVFVYVIKKMAGSAFVVSLLNGYKIKDFSHKIRNSIEEFLLNGKNDGQS